MRLPYSRSAVPFFALLAFTACATPPVPGTDVPTGDVNTVETTVDVPVSDVSSLDASMTDTPTNTFDAGPVPTAILPPTPGEVSIYHLDLPSGITLRMGEASVVVGPDGTIVLIDIGNSNHDDDVRNFVQRLNTQWLTPARGFAARRPLQVEWVLLTHDHSDHIGAFTNLFSGSSRLEVSRGIIHRGYVDVGAGTNEADYGAMCTLLQGTLRTLDVPLCQGTQPAPCASAQWVGNHLASSCPGLRKGALDDPTDDLVGAPSYIPLGQGARIDLVAANGFAVSSTGMVQSAPFGHTDTNEENARSVAGVVRHGSFRYFFAGDLTGSGAATEPDVETFVVTTASAMWGTLGMDVTHAGHHARKTSSNTGFITAMAPTDGRSRNVVAGINPMHLGSPHAEVLDRWTTSDRLQQGWFWVTHTTTGSGTSPRLVDANGPLVVQTLEGGRAYWMQAAGSTVRSQSYRSLRASP